MAFEQLPKELKVCILRHIKEIPDRLSCEKVCREWRNILVLSDPPVCPYDITGIWIKSELDVTPALFPDSPENGPMLFRIYTDVSYDSILREILRPPVLEAPANPFEVKALPDSVSASIEVAEQRRKSQHENREPTTFDNFVLGLLEHVLSRGAVLKTLKMEGWEDLFLSKDGEVHHRSSMLFHRVADLLDEYEVKLDGFWISWFSCSHGTLDKEKAVSKSFAPGLDYILNRQPSLTKLRVVMFSDMDDDAPPGMEEILNPWPCTKLRTVTFVYMHRFGYRDNLNKGYPELILAHKCMDSDAAGSLISLATLRAIPTDKDRDKVVESAQALVSISRQRAPQLIEARGYINVDLSIDPEDLYDADLILGIPEHIMFGEPIRLA